MSIFGWSYPAGCSGTPYDETCYCNVCGKSDTKCICPECPECSEVGNPECYEQHGMVRTQEQIDSLATEKALWEAEAAEGPLPDIEEEI